MVMTMSKKQILDALEENSKQIFEFQNPSEEVAEDMMWRSDAGDDHYWYMFEALIEERERLQFALEMAETNGNSKKYEKRYYLLIDDLTRKFGSEYLTKSILFNNAEELESWYNNIPQEWLDKIKNGTVKLASVYRYFIKSGEDENSMWLNEEKIFTF